MNQIVPLSNSPNQNLIVPLNIDGVVKDYYLTLRYNEIAGYWAMTVQDQLSKVIIDSLPMITGEAPSANVLGQFAHLGIGSAYIINASSVQSPDYPNSGNLGTDFVLIWGDTPSA